MVQLLSALVVGALLAAGGGAGKRERRTAECQKDADCVLVPDGCCGCHEGGKQRAIPARARAAHERKRQETCRETLCPAVMSQHASCEAQAVCKEGTCALGS